MLDIEHSKRFHKWSWLGVSYEVNEEDKDSQLDLAYLYFLHFGKYTVNLCMLNKQREMKAVSDWFAMCAAESSHTHGSIKTS